MGYMRHITWILQKQRSSVHTYFHQEVVVSITRGCKEQQMLRRVRCSFSFVVIRVGISKKVTLEVSEEEGFAGLGRR